MFVQMTNKNKRSLLVINFFVLYEHTANWVKIILTLRCLEQRKLHSIFYCKYFDTLACLKNEKKTKTH